MMNDLVCLILHLSSSRPYFLFFFCLSLFGSTQKDEPPEITYCVVNQNGMLQMQPLSPALPMPEESELDAKFTELLVRKQKIGTALLPPSSNDGWHFSFHLLHCEKKNGDGHCLWDNKTGSRRLFCLQMKALAPTPFLFFARAVKWRCLYFTK